MKTHLLIKLIVDLKKESSTNKKIEIIQKYFSNIDISKGHYFNEDVWYLEMVLNPYVNFGIREIKGDIQYIDIDLQSAYPKLDLKDLNTLLYELSGQASYKVSGNEALFCCNHFKNNARNDIVALLELALKKSLDCGADYKLFNKALPGYFDYSFKISKAYPYKKGKLDYKFPVHAEIKENGVRCIIKLNTAIPGNITIYSSSGRECHVNSFYKLRNTLTTLCKFNVFPNNSILYLDGELISKNRKLMSGIFNKALKNTFSKEDDVDIEYRVFDLLFEDEWDSKKCNRAYSKRRQQLVNIFERTMINTTEDLSNIHLVKDYIVENEDELFELFNHVYKQGNEGLIIKSSNSKYSFKRSYDWMKLKGENECDLKIVQVNLGEGKRKGLIGSLTCCSNDNKLKVDVGSGFNDKELEYLTSIKDELIGKIITVKYNEIINNKDNEYSLFLPIFIELRTDKTEADNIEKIMSECNLSEL